MTHGEYDRWIEAYCELFPSLIRWLRSQQPDIALSQRMLWQETLEGVSLQEALAVTKLMAIGDLETVPDFREERTAAIVRRHALDRRTTEKPEQEQAELRRARRRGDGRREQGFLGGVLAEILRRQEAGQSSEEIAEAIWGPPQPEYAEPRYRCWLCRDTGRVEVYRPNQRREDGTLRTCMTACRCETGSQFVSEHREKGKWTQSARYASDRYTLLSEGPDAYFAQQVTSLPNYSTSLAEWNNS